MPTQYDPSVIVKQADLLYSQANTIAITYCIAGLILGPIVAALAAAQIAGSGELKIAAFVGAIIGAIGGLAIGQSRGQALRFEAQIGLCHLQTEFNTRHAAAAQPTMQPPGWQR